MSRIDQAFAQLRADKRTGLITYTTAGDPDLPLSRDVLLALAHAGADLLEVGVPFSDPLADGPVIQRATERALAAGSTLTRVLQVVADVRARVATPIVLFTYVNPLHRMGFATFAREAAGAGADGVLALDLPIEEAGEFRDLLAQHDLDTIFLLSPTTTTERIKRAAALGRGFLYGISRLGVTGARDTVSVDAAAMVARIRNETSMPVAVGFGVSHPDHVTEIGRFADAAVVGSSLVNVVARHGQADTLVTAVDAYVRWLKGTIPVEQASGAGAW
jgi:tryptophan synthase alpha chain